MNFHDTELRVIRWAEANGGFHGNEETQTLRIAANVVSHVGDLCESIAHGRQIYQISDAMGRVAIDMIVLCAILDVDLAKSLETAFNKISAKPVDASNVVLLKRDDKS